MTSKEAISKIRTLLFGSQPEADEAKAEIAMGTAVSSEGVTLQWEGDLAVGTLVFVAVEGQEPVLSGEAEYSVDGIGTVMVGADGAVTEIVPAPTEQAPETEQVEQAETDEGAEGEAAPNIEERVARLEEGMQMIIDLLNQIAGEQAEYSARMSAIEGEPSAKKVGLGLSQVTEDRPKTNYERRMDAINSLKK